MRVLAFDLAWTGKTGWAIWDDGTGIQTLAEIPLYPFVSYGEFAPKGKAIDEIAVSLHNLISKVAQKLPPNNVIAIEKTDWHRNLHGISGRKLAEQYAIERQAQRCLGRAESVAAMAIQPGTWGSITKIVFIGANEAKREFGATKKGAVARLIAEEYPDRFRHQNKKTSFLFDIGLNHDVSHNESDAMMIAQVTARREILNAKVENSA